MFENDIKSPSDALAALRRAKQADDNILQMMLAVGLNPKTDFRGGTWRKCNFNGLDLRGCNFQGADIRSAKFDGANIADANFQGAKVRNATLYLAANTSSAIFDDNVRAEVLLGAARSQGGSVRSAVEAYAKAERPLIDRDYVALISTTEKFADARWLLDHMNERSEVPSPYAYCAVISKAEGFFISNQLFDEFLSKGGIVDEALLNAHLENINTVDAGLAFLERYPEFGQKPNTWAFNIVLDHVTSADEAMRIVSKMEDAGCAADNFTFNLLLGLFHEPDAFEKILSLMAASNTTVRLEDINMIVRQVRGEVGLAYALGLFERFGLSMQAWTFNMLLWHNWQQDKGINAAFDLIDQMRLRGLPSDSATLANLLRNCRNIQDVIDSFIEMNKDHVPLFSRQVAKSIVEISKRDPLPEYNTPWHVTAGKMLENGDPPSTVIRSLMRAYARERGYLSKLDKVGLFNAAE